MIEHTRRIRTSINPDIAYDVLKNVSHFSQFISGVDSVEVKKNNEHNARNVWFINMQGNKVQWEEEERVDDKNRKISFKRIKGDFDILEGYKSVRSIKDGSEIVVSLKLDWSSNKLLDRGFISRKSSLALRWMLRAIREQLGAGSIVLYDHYDNKSGFTITSELVRYNNRLEKQIVAFVDRLKTNDRCSDFIIIPPGYGETKRDAITLSYYLVCNGFNVLRYDASDHVGESEGDIFYTTLPKMKDDILSSLDYLQKRFGCDKAGIVATSLAKRVALKAASEDTRISFLLGLVGIVNLRSTLEAVYNQDLIGIVESYKDKSFDVAEVLGYEVSREFPRTAIEGKYHDLQSTRDDIKRLKIPFVFIVAEKDTWVRLEDVKLVFESSANTKKELYIMKDTLHLIYENPKSVRSVLKQVVVSCGRYMLDKQIGDPDIVEPGLRQIAQQNKIEKMRLRRLTKISKESEKEFWKSYLNKYIVITKSKDFRDFLSLIELLLGAANDNEIILDAGCGNGHFGAWLLWTALARHKELGNKAGIIKRRRYVGIDFVEDVLAEARTRHIDIQGSVVNELKLKRPFMEFEYQCLDMEQRLPFPDNHFDKICCNLVLSYLKNSFFALSELVRVLKTSGRIVVTSLKPYPDLSHIYKSFVTEASNETEVKEARILLSGAGKIKQRESEGHYVFFSESRLKSMFSRLKVVDVKTYMTFANQALIITAEKQ
ncbi:MAG: methyltransferase domain-containing protein [Candidatus Omnitrophota bacterium]